MRRQPKEHPITSDFGRRLKVIRLGRRPLLSQSTLAERAGFDHSHVSRLESGARLPTREAVIEIAKALGCTDQERDTLLHAAGYSAADIGSLLHLPSLAELDACYAAASEDEQARIACAVELIVRAVRSKDAA
jgi:transcriptional regulator with XRE-family HTH domain